MFARRLSQLTRLTSVVGVTLLLPLAVWNRDLVVLWVGERNYAGPAVTWLAFANTWLLAVTGIWGWPLMAGGKVRLVVPCIMTSVAGEPDRERRWNGLSRTAGAARWDVRWALLGELVVAASAGPP